MSLPHFPLSSKRTDKQALRVSKGGRPEPALNFLGYQHCLNHTRKKSGVSRRISQTGSTVCFHVFIVATAVHEPLVGPWRNESLSPRGYCETLGGTERLKPLNGPVPFWDSIIFCWAAVKQFHRVTILGKPYKLLHIPIMRTCISS